MADGIWIILTLGLPVNDNHQKLRKGEFLAETQHFISLFIAIDEVATWIYIERIITEMSHNTTKARQRGGNIPRVSLCDSTIELINYSDTRQEKTQKIK